MKRFNLMPNESAAMYMDNSSVSHGRGGRDWDLVIISLPIILALAIIYFLGVRQSTDVSVNVMRTQTQKLEELRKEYDVVLAMSADVKRNEHLIEERNRLQNSLDTIRSLGVVKSIPLDILVSVGRNISEKLALTEISKRNDTVLIEGLARDNRSLSDFIDILEKQRVFKGISVRVSEYSDQYGPYKQKFLIEGKV